MRLRPIRVMGANGKLLSVNPGHAWPAPYRRQSVHGTGRAWPYMRKLEARPT